MSAAAGPGTTARIPHASAHTPMPVEPRGLHMMGSESKAVLALEPKPATEESAKGWWLSAGAFVVVAVGATVGLRLYQEANTAAQTDPVITPVDSANEPANSTAVARGSEATNADPSADQPQAAGSGDVETIPTTTATTTADTRDAGAASVEVPPEVPTETTKPTVTTPPASTHKPPRRPPTPQPEPQPENKWGF